MAGRRLFDESEGDDLLFARRKLADSEMDITPMIDCVFQLLIFFMVASNMQGGQTSDVPVAQFGIGVETNRATIITVEAGGPGGRGKILLEGNRESNLEGVRQLVAERLREGRNQVIIKADRMLTHGAVQEVVRAVTENEGAQFYIAVKDR
jgi:biopolymer transport protein ExbD